MPLTGIRTRRIAGSFALFNVLILDADSARSHTFVLTPDLGAVGQPWALRFIGPADQRAVDHPADRASRFGIRNPARTGTVAVQGKILLDRVAGHDGIEVRLVVALFWAKNAAQPLRFLLARTEHEL